MRVRARVVVVVGSVITLAGLHGGDQLIDGKPAQGFVDLLLRALPRARFAIPPGTPEYSPERIDDAFEANIPNGPTRYTERTKGR